MACGTPVITDGATRLRVESLEGTAVAVGRVGDLDPRAIRARVEQRFSAEAMVAGDERVYASTRNTHP
jgi:hypothetical protein